MKQVTTSGDCADTEICVDGFRPRDLPYGPLHRVAYCVDISNFVRIAKDNTAAESAVPQVVMTDVEALKTGQIWTVQAVMTEADNMTSLLAESLEMQAQTYTILSNMQLWHTMIGGSAACAECSSVALQQVPIGAQRIKADVILPTATAVGLLYVVSVAW